MTPLNKAEIQTLNEALDDEYLAWTTYDQVIADLGAVPPFPNIKDAEARHIEALCTLFMAYGLSVPENPWPGKVARYASRQAACEAGIAAEIANGKMYERLLETSARPDLLAVLRNLQEASQQRHLAAFQRCAQGTINIGGRHGGKRHRE